MKQPNSSVRLTNNHKEILKLAAQYSVDESYEWEKSIYFNRGGHKNIAHAKTRWDIPVYINNFGIINPVKAITNPLLTIYYNKNYLLKLIERTIIYPNYDKNISWQIKTPNGVQTIPIPYKRKERREPFIGDNVYLNNSSLLFIGKVLSFNHINQEVLISGLKSIFTKSSKEIICG